MASIEFKDQSNTNENHYCKEKTFGSRRPEFPYIDHNIMIV